MTASTATSKKCLTRKESDIALKAGDIVQNSIVEPGRCWKVKQTIDTVTPGNPDYNEKSAYAKTMQKDNAHVGRRQGRRRQARAQRQQHDLLRMSHVVGDELLWLPSVDGGQPQDAQPA